MNRRGSVFIIQTPTVTFYSNKFDFPCEMMPQRDQWEVGGRETGKLKMLDEKEKCWVIIKRFKFVFLSQLQAQSIPSMTPRFHVGIAVIFERHRMTPQKNMDSTHTHVQEEGGCD